MGILCSCYQPVIYSQQNKDIEVDHNIPNPKYFANKSTSKSKFLTKDTTLINHSNNNSPDKDDLCQKTIKNKFTELESNNTKFRAKTNNNKRFKKNETDIKANVTFNSSTPTKIKKEENKTYTNNIHIIKNEANLFNRNSVPLGTSTINKLNLKNFGNNKLILGYRANSSNIEKRPLKILLALKNSNDSMKLINKKKFNKTAEKLNKKDKNFKLAYSIKTGLTLEQEDQKIINLHQNFFFMNYNKNFLDELIDYMNILNYNDKEIIFGKGEIANNFYIIKKGIVLLTSDGKIYKKLTSGDTFGEIALFQNELTDYNLDDNNSINNNDLLTRNYSAISKGKTILFSLNFSSYYNVIKNFDNSKKEKFMTNMEDNLNEKNKDLIKNYKFLRYLEEQHINLMTKMAKKYIFQKIGILLSISNYNKFDNINSLFDKRPFFKSRQNLLLIIEGEIMEFSEDLIYRKKIKKNGGSGNISILYPQIKNQIYAKINHENTKVIYIPEEIFIEVLGPNYSYEILKYYFLNRFFEKNNILSAFLDIKISTNNINDINTLEEDDKNKIFEIYNAFSVKEYNQNEIIYSHKNNLEEKKIIMPIMHNISIYNIDSKKIESFKKNIILEEIFYEYNREFIITAENSFTLVLESSWKNIYDYIVKSKNKLNNLKLRFDIYKNLINSRPLYSLNIQQLIEIGLNSIIKEFSPKEKIIKNKEKNNLFYIIIKGRVKVKHPITNKTLRIYEEGNCFGCHLILNESPSDNNYISHQYTKCYCLTAEKFYEFLKINSFNDYIKNKLLLEDDEMQLNDFYYISYLGKGAFGYVCLVHNQLSFYAMKAINRFTIEKGKNGVKNLINEKKCMIAIDHPFIVNYVKTLKNNNWVFILEEYIKGKNLEDYLMARKINRLKNINELIFYSGCLFLMLKYLTQRRICHRDIKPKNIMIETDGYLKLLDFGCSKKIKFFSQTVVGTPNYMSPEVLRGIEYSFNCDYWSVGVCCYLIFFGKLPFGDEINDVMQLYKDILKAKVKIPKDCPLNVKELIDGLLKKNVTERINTFNKVKECQIFQNFDWDNLFRKKLKAPYIPVSEDFWGKSNLNNLESPFNNFIEEKWAEATGMQLSIYKHKIMNGDDDDNINYRNDDNNNDLINNWFDYF